MPPDDELILMQRVAGRDQAALSELYRRYAGLVYGVAMRVLQNPTLAEEVLQDTFVKVWREPGKWNPEGGKLVNWLATVTRYTAIDRLRKELRQPPLTPAPLDEIPHLAAKVGNIDELAWHDTHLLQSLMDQLPPPQLEVIQLAFWQGMTHSEISQKLALPLGTVKSRLQLGLRRLRALADEEAQHVPKSS
jgi:RNA polymerase sigma-70 factor (ECF subfamily)